MTLNHRIRARPESVDIVQPVVESESRVVQDGRVARVLAKDECIEGFVFDPDKKRAEIPRRFVRKSFRLNMAFPFDLRTTDLRRYFFGKKRQQTPQ